MTLSPINTSKQIIYWLNVKATLSVIKYNDDN